MRAGCDADVVIETKYAGRPCIDVVHLDIKPQNILMGEINESDPHALEHKWPKIRLTDFGVSVELQSEWSSPKDFSGRGAPGYMAPEQFH